MTQRFVFHLDEKLGVDGHGERWLAHEKSGRLLEVWLFDNTQSHIKAAVKQLREAKPLLDAMKHRHVQEVIKIGRRDKRVYLVAARMKGRPLLEAVRAAPITADDLDRGLKMAEGACGALAYLNGYCHPSTGRMLRRNYGIIEPSRIRVDEAGEITWGDLGVPRAGAGDFRRLSVDARRCSTGLRAPPGTLDGRADIQALGVLIYKLLSGHWPYQEGVPVREALADGLIPIRQRSPWIPEAVEEAVMRALSSGFDTVAAFGLALTRCRRRLARGGDGLMTFDEVLPWLRERAYDDDLPAITALLHSRRDLAEVSVVSDYVWRHFGERLMGPLIEDRPMPEPWHMALERLPAAIPALTSIIEDESRTDHSRIMSARLLTKLRACEASGSLIKAMNAPSRRVAQAAAEAVRFLDDHKPLRLDRAQARIVPCSMRWEDLRPVDTQGCETRHCDACDHEVVRVSDVESLAAIAAGRCVFFEPPEQTTGLALVLDNRVMHHLEQGQVHRIGVDMTLDGASSNAFAELISLGGGLLCIRARSGSVHVAGVQVGEAIMDTSRRDKVRVGSILFSVAGPDRIRASGLSPWRRAMRMGRIVAPRF